jgi:hypothetical protein
VFERIEALRVKLNAIFDRIVPVIDLHVLLDLDAPNFPVLNSCVNLLALLWFIWRLAGETQAMLDDLWDTPIRSLGAWARACVSACVRVCSCVFVCVCV